MEIDQTSAWNAWKMGAKEYENGNGESLELLIDATDYLDRNPDSGIMEGEEQSYRTDGIPSIDYLEKNHSTIAKRSPVKIPENATYVVQEKNGYNQIKYTWESDGYKYTSRWHTRTPNAPESQETSWVVERRIPGIGYGEHHRRSEIEVLVGENIWISKLEWKEAIEAQHNGTTTKQQKEWLDNGHWKDE